MAKTPSKQQASINELGGLPPEFEVGTQQEQTVVTDNSETQPDPEVQKETSTSEEPPKTPEISDDQNKVSGESETQENTTESELGSDDSDEMELVVVKGQTLRHSGETYAENSRLFLPCSDASRLIDLGVVADVKALRQQEARISGPSITVDDGVKINRGS
ncbi:TPA: hypothetical protein PXQ76_002495 [Yersinia enterocolitica]|nr:hypothetical protein [Yersinia enterocolitica]HDL8026135.1 hypothetical protein [Yersinia enterocolitica]HDL8160819.1 hypothetical protein [Yersinia enterocolitica]HDL8164665.1 hypothetical protein [Yersinia enterocolitica]HDL8168711.1 hypothetical protein [Yersinia enterocolitica]